jgi:HPt (histidine-containing phosphotransfer) domain-containing protein
LANGDEVFKKEMIRIFIRATENGIKDIKQALNEKNWQGISDAAHKMAAPCKHLMANDLYDSLKKLENNAGNKKSLQFIPEIIQTIEKKVIAINNSLTDIIESERFAAK